MKVLFRKVKNNHERIRTSEATGTTQRQPKVGEQFVMFSHPLDKNASVRRISTSPVKRIEKIDNGWRLFTESESIYEVLKIEGTTIH